MADEPTNDNPVDEPQDTPAEPQDTPGDDPGSPADEPQDEPGVGFNKTQLQQLSSMTGRLIAKQIDEKVLPRLQPEQSPIQTISEDDKTGNVLTKFNEQRQEEILSGDVYGAVDKILQVRDSMAQKVQQQRKQETDKAITKYSEEPYYKDIH